MGGRHDGPATAEWVTAYPAPPLAAFVDRYVGYRYAGFPPSLHRGLPSRHMTFIVPIGEAVDVREHTDPRQPPGVFRTVLSGLQRRPARIADPGFGEGVAIELSPVGARALVGMPAAELWDITVELRDAVGPAGDALHERLQRPASWPERFAACDAVLTALLGDRSPDARLEAAWRMLAAHHGRLPVDVLAHRLGWTRQHLTRRFRAEYGLGPALAGRIIRFDRARTRVQAGGAPVEVAHLCGYADQAHMTREFTELAGCGPAALAREEVPSVQDDAPAVVGR